MQIKSIFRYLDEENGPLYPFGHGLSYSEFVYSDLRLSNKQLTRNEQLTLSFTVSNLSNQAGYTLPQIYFQDAFTQIIRPKKNCLHGSQYL